MQWLSPEYVVFSITQHQSQPHLHPCQGKKFLLHLGTREQVGWPRQASIFWKILQNPSPTWTLGFSLLGVAVIVQYPKSPKWIFDNKNIIQGSSLILSGIQDVVTIVHSAICIFVGSVVIPCLLTTWPMYFTSWRNKLHLLGDSFNLVGPLDETDLIHVYSKTREHLV